MKTERSKTSFCSRPSGTSSECRCCRRPSSPPWRQLEIRVLAFKLRARTWREATPADHLGGGFIHFHFIFFSKPLLCGAENVACVRIKVGLGSRRPVCAQRGSPDPIFPQISPASRAGCWCFSSDFRLGTFRKRSAQLCVCVSFAATLHSFPIHLLFLRDAAAGVSRCASARKCAHALTGNASTFRARSIWKNAARSVLLFLPCAIYENSLRVELGARE